ncbi:hypothetical protein chiPu_0000802 [Chiloscyllium punctatum]|uniref:WWE domain-containing protein n=1 Tax=Chiloscyllium punctatum TaxID=137246 RepID=A0A401RWA2_CHIPU|nr:hypothetical protein [Chiloscyllium punctatum]
MAGEEYASMMEEGSVEEMDTSDTQWNWYYLGECGKWHIFERDPNISSSMSSEDIEMMYRMNPQGCLSFSTAKFNYTLDFQAMTQTNKATGRQRPVKRAAFTVTAFRLVKSDSKNLSKCDEAFLIIDCKILTYKPILIISVF